MRQNGFTLIEMLISLVVAMLCINMLFMMFMQVSQVSLQSSQDAEYDTELQIGLMVAQKYLQGAGFGSGKPADIAAGTFSGNAAIFWRQVPDTTAPTIYQCQGLGEEISVESGRQVHRLILLKRPLCDGTSGVETGVWERDQIIVAIEDGTNTPIYTFDLVANSSCSPYGMGDTTVAKKQINVSGRRQYMTGTGEAIQSAICLTNITAI